METFRFLDFKNPEHLFDITLDSVKTTEGVNTAIATITMIGKNAIRQGKMPESLWVTAKICPTFAKSHNVTLRYDNGMKKFSPIPVFPANAAGNAAKNKNIVSKIKVVFSDFISERLEQCCAQPLSEILFEKDFPEIASNTELRISSKGTTPPIYFEPLNGPAIPLWCIGGYYSNHCPLSRIESLFVFPLPKRNQEMALKTYHFSEIVEKDPDFALGNTAHFAAVQGPPWNLVAEIEKGQAKLSVQCEEKVVVFSSVRIVKSTILSDEVVIKFVKKGG
ncbi:MAG: hypothetical protein LBF84_03035 [Holosporales bacterium]|jgi:hypothetical protein|nr:hypothetical protein [Holosporales bacterium]